ncbi:MULTISPECIES: hypothetical protein [Pseudoalteromonas]|uniref:hypothetical protein n=1 Tax=Pseudoalteromonas TaxID=53246 RepID=UPI0007C56284|nr:MULTISPECIES: hypothetical protein [Pseudoalteromonas]TMP46487.1 hypothetical protein CWB80_10025 [Pseudoalteromonas sp. S1650]TMP66009.1 hypothetical protein CWB79_13610 [Pseudoalteromonas sp. S1649]
MELEQINNHVSILNVVLDGSGSMSVFGKGPLQVNLARFVQQYIEQKSAQIFESIEVNFFLFREQVKLLENGIDSGQCSISFEGGAESKSLSNFLKYLPSQSKVLLFSDGFCLDDQVSEVVNQNAIDFNLVAVGPDSPPLERYRSEYFHVAKSESLPALLQNLLYKSEGNTLPHKISTNWEMEEALFLQTQNDDDDWE